MESELFDAIEANDFDKVKTLITEDNIDINVRDNDGGTPLHAVFINECPDIDMVKYLIEKGANVNAINDKGRTALMYACEFFDEDIVQYLIENGADINIKDNNGITALVISCEIVNLPTVKLLIENGARVK